MNWIIYHFVSGGAFFTGSAMVLMGAALGIASKYWCRRCASVLSVTGAVFIAASATPISYWFYALFGFIMALWLIATSKKKKSSSLRWQLLLSLLLMVACVAGVAMELRHHRMPTIEVTKNNSILIFGDSVTAGIGEESETWPHILTREKGLSIQDQSRPGATIATTLKQVSETKISEGIVILEIGGNDLLGSTSVAHFRRDLKAMLQQLSSPPRQVIMFELPLLPLSNSFGRAQRELARDYNVKLIPKRVFARVLTAEDATLDSIHLSQQGHQLMADAVWQIIERAFGQRKPC